ncbi:hypothetical protein [Streptomyces sp. NBC_01257]|uniref:hypothetical protein n=1 Tax=Streptomyces sp. NBC_01257 TaxID=2903799 RepID=UPI002DD933A3|nr:hypothetical protein [Streptomyces sp. NBC_01257]WRZ62613.1 hypothetical protein OG408_01430 [Streptomyces sp. NBC_01257]
MAAITVEDEAFRLTVGGSDEEAICSAADKGEVPRRWAALIDEVHDQSATAWGVDYGDLHGMSWTLPSLKAGEHCELPVVAAWARTTVADDSANTWYAVMPSPTTLQRQVMAEPTTRAERLKRAEDRPVHRRIEGEATS